MAASILRRHLPAIIKNNLHTSSMGSGYVVLIPESVADSPDTNPLLKRDSLLDLSGLTTDQCVDAVQKLTLDYDSGIWKIEENLENGSISFQDVLSNLEDLASPLDSAWSVAKVLYLCGGSPEMPSSTYEKLHHAARSAKAKRFFSHKIHSAALETLGTMGKSAKSQVQTKDEQELRRVVGKYALEGRLNGLELVDEDQQILFTKIRNELVGETLRFNTKLSVATKMFTHTITDPNLVRDFPHDLLEEMAMDRSQPSRGPWKVTLVGGVAPRFMEHCPSASLRWNVWQASVRRASAHGANRDLAPSVFDTLRGKKVPSEEDLNNSTHVEKIRDLRKQLASILGFENAAVMSMETKMARSVESVRSMIASLLLQAKPAQDKELASLHDFAKDRGHPPSAPLDIWDIPYWRRKRIRSSLGGLEEDGLRAFFPLEKVLKGLFQLCGQLFSVQVEPLPLPMKGASVWHPDVRLYALNDSSSGETLGAFYLDPFVRPGSKLSSSEVPGWMLGIHNRTTNNIPLAALIFNFPMPSDKRPCLLSPREVHSLFCKFGHVVQHLLCRAKNSEVFGLNNVEWDAVDVCSNFMGLWLTDVKTLKDVSGHHQTGEPISEEVAKILATESQQLAGYDLCKELYLSDLDLELHTSDDFWLDVVRRLWPVYFSLPLDRQDSHVCSFRAAFETGSGGGNYFSRPWSHMVAADIFDAFTEELSNVSKDEMKVEAAGKIGARFRSTYLTLGGACHPGEVFRQFRGRDPSPSALLCSLGLKTKKQH